MADDDDKIRAEVSVGPVEFKDPDVIGVGEVRCRCGAYRMSNVKGTVAVQMIPSCCGSVLEVVPFDH